MSRILTYLALFFLPFALYAQDANRTMTHEVYEIWNKIENPQLSNYGNWATYAVTNEKGDSRVVVYNTRSGEELSFDRSSGAVIDAGELFIAFKTVAHIDTIKAMKRRKVKKAKMPKDTLCILNLKTKGIERIPNVEAFKLSNEHAGSIAFKLVKRTLKQDSTLVKDEGKENGSVLVIKDVMSNKSKTIPYVKEFQWSKKNGFLAIHTIGEDTLKSDKVLLYNSSKQAFKNVQSSEGEYKNFAFNEEGSRLAFLVDTDTTGVKAKTELMTYAEGQTKATSRANTLSGFLKEEWQISEHQKPYFLQNSESVVFGVSPIKLEADTTLLDEEKVELEIWNYKDGYLHTRQESRKKQDDKKSYKAVFDFKTNTVTQLQDLSNSEMNLSSKINGNYLLSYDNSAYTRYESWKGHDYKDIFLVNLKTGKRDLIASQIEGRPRMSPAGDYAYWYSRTDTAWHAYSVERKTLKKITSSRFYDELNDRPMHPWTSGTVGWNDKGKFLIYDHYDLWEVDPNSASAPIRLTSGRESKTRYRYVSLDNELLDLPADTTILLSVFNQKDKSSGYAYLNLKTKELKEILSGPFDYDDVLKAKKSDDILYTKESFEIFPDLIHSNLSFRKSKVISKANPQQKDYDWGSIELFQWKDKDGIIRDALIAKPANFNPAKKYPLLVNFYEKSSQGLHRHRAPYAHRSTINYTYYTNRGYVIFNPDIYYKDGYPGESCYDAVMASVDALLEEGYIDEDNMGLQGHSWGGYQIAYILTKTDRFKCAESGAPVVNMVSAYGGIRWGSGRSRMFQYEKTQSRIGATLWERPDLYLYNSPIFQLDKVNTPVLILHNDNDGAVPWYQGIEYFVGLRRLGKPTWMLNYNGEPHWPLKKQNRIDFNRRMEQFFDHYLKSKKLPLWMRDGIPVVNKGIIDGFELTNDQDGK